MADSDAGSNSSLGLHERTLGLLGLAVVLVGAVLWSARGTQVEKTDFSLTYVGAYIVHAGAGANLYDIELQKKVRNTLFQDPNPLFYEHPPFEALLLSPLAALPFRVAYSVWGFLNAIVWVLLIFFLRPYLAWPREEFAYLVLWLLFAPLGVALFQGQSSLLVLAAFSITFIQVEKQRELAAGLAMGLALVKLQFVLPFALIMLFRRKWRFLAGFAITCVFFGVLSLGTAGFEGTVRYARFLITIGNNPQNMSFGSAVDMPTIYGFIYAVLHGVLSHRGLNSTVAGLSILLLWYIARRWNAADSASSNELMFAAATAGCLLTSSHMFTHDFSPLLLAMFSVCAILPGVKAPPRIGRMLTVLLVGTCAVFWTFPVYFVCVAWHCLFLMCPVLAVFAFSVLVAAKYTDDRRQVEVQFVTAG